MALRTVNARLCRTLCYVHDVMSLQTELMLRETFSPYLSVQCSAVRPRPVAALPVAEHAQPLVVARRVRRFGKLRFLQGSMRMKTVVRPLHPMAVAENVVGGMLADLVDPTQVRAAIMAILRDEEYLAAYRALPSTLNIPQIGELGASEHTLFGGLPIKGIEQVSILLKFSILYLVRIWSFQGIQNLHDATAPSAQSGNVEIQRGEPMAFMSQRMPSAYKRVLLAEKVAEVCLFGLGAYDRFEYADGVGEALVALFVENQMLFLSLQAGVLKRWGDAEDFWSGFVEPMDIDAIEREFQESEQGYQQLLSRARESGRAVYPEFSGDELSSRP